MSPWTALLFEVRAALDGRSSAKSVALAAERCRYLAREPAGPPALLYNALKTMAEAWPHEPALADPIARLVSLCELNPIKFFPPPRRASGRTVPNPYWLRDDR